MNFLASLVRPSSYADVPAEKHQEKSFKKNPVPKIVNFLFDELDKWDEHLEVTLSQMKNLVDPDTSELKPTTNGITDAKCGCAANSNVYGNLQHFDGTETPVQASAWLRKLNEAHEKNRWTEAFTYEIASNLLKNSARKWAQMENPTMKTWRRFKVEFNHEYCNVRKESISKYPPASIEQLCRWMSNWEDGLMVPREKQLQLIDSKVNNNMTLHNYDRKYSDDNSWNAVKLPNTE